VSFLNRRLRGHEGLIERRRFSSEKLVFKNIVSDQVSDTNGKRSEHQMKWHGRIMNLLIAFSLAPLAIAQSGTKARD
jgi:hypothetical protein